MRMCLSNGSSQLSGWRKGIYASSVIFYNGTEKKEEVKFHCRLNELDRRTQIKAFGRAILVQYAVEHSHYWCTHISAGVYQ
jgi:hypothetical protein